MDLLLPSVSEIRKLDETARLVRCRHSQIGSISAPDVVLKALSRLKLDCFPIEFSICETCAAYPRLEDSYAYELKVADEGVAVRSDTQWGALSACTTLAKLVREGQLPVCEIADRPVYPWRGLMIDTSRHFMPIPRLEETLDLMFWFQLNVLHLNLSNDQACRFTSASAPRLAAEDHYTSVELTQLVTYAAERGIRVVPELDVPGHTTSWVWAYPEWGSQNLESPSTGFGIHDACLDPTREVVMDSVKQVFSDLTEVFRDEYVHLGGDEVTGKWWQANDRIQQWMAEQNLTTTHALQTWFVCEIGEHLKSLGKRTIGWDEILDANLPQEFVIQAWRGMGARDAAVQAGHATIVSSPYYLDLFFPADFHYRFEPSVSQQVVQEAVESAQSDYRLMHVADGIAWQQTFGSFPSLAKRNGGSVLGGEACMWSELVDSDTLHTRVWSRMPAIAERLWRGTEGVSLDQMYARLEASLSHLIRSGRSPPALLNLPKRLNPPFLHPLIELLEPVKWYSRLIGVDRMHARSTGQPEAHLKRPYDLSTPLSRVVDYLPAESMAARRIRRSLADGSDLRVKVESWQNQQLAIDEVASNKKEFEELIPLSANLARLAEIYNGKSAIDYRLAEPVGEYLLPVAKPILDQALLKLLTPFDVGGDVTEIKRGHINDTFVIGKKALAQRINGSVFNVPAVLANRSVLDRYICDVVPSVLRTKSDDDHVDGYGGEVWRVAEYVPSRAFDRLPDDLCYEAGVAFGGFLTKLSNCTAKPEPVIDGFHNLTGYLAELDALPRDPSCIELLNFVDSVREQATAFPVREFQVIHGDCKVNNLLFAEDSSHVLRIVDLDTLMWGHPAWDYGDLVRSILTGESDMDLVTQRINSVTLGFTNRFQISTESSRTFALAPAHMSFMLGVRFLVDHLRGDNYFKVANHGENKERADEQFELMRWFTKHTDVIHRSILNQ